MATATENSQEKAQDLLQAVPEKDRNRLLSLFAKGIRSTWRTLQHESDQLREQYGDRSVDEQYWQNCERLASRYRTWIRLATWILGTAGREPNFKSKDVLEDIRRAYQEALLMPLDVDQLRKSFAEMEQGQGISLEALREWLQQKA